MSHILSMSLSQNLCLSPSHSLALSLTLSLLNSFTFTLSLSHSLSLSHCLGWKNAQSAHQLQERERRIKNHLQLAAKGPLRQTFAENPVQKKESHREKQKARPWEDTIG
uniref:Uncharacterized protein n=1 Tax=Callorhinchus milii TaxID=7868 RepID=A0A4W3GD96_CALMI